MTLLPARRTQRLVATTVGAFLLALGVFSLIESGSNGVSPRSVGHLFSTGASSNLRRPTNTVEKIANLQAGVRARPLDAGLWAALGLTYYQRVRETGDFSFYTRAQGVLETARHLDPRSVDATVGLATIALARHDFRSGLAYSRAALALNPLGHAAYSGLIDGLVETGQYTEAGQVIQRFSDTRPSLASYARASYFAELHGDIPAAVTAMRFAVSAGADAPENAAYVQTLLGDLEFVQGHLKAARTAYGQALSSVPGYPLADAGVAQVDAAQGRFESAINRLREVVSRLPLPQHIVALGEAEQAAGRPAQAAQDLQLIGAEEKLLMANGVNTDVDLALYEANHGSTTRAVAFGRRAWAAAPSVRSADALGWALTSAGHAREGLGWSRQALSLGSIDPTFLYHAGIAARDTGHRAEARTDLAAAVARNPRFSPLYGPRAQQALRSLR